MDNTKKNIVYSLVVAVVFFGLSVFCWIKPADDFSATERRQLKQFPELTQQTILSGKFMGEFESYTLDQFPLRDSFRGIKAIVNQYVFMQSDNNDVYLSEGYLSKQEYPLSEKALQKAVRKFNSVYDTYIKDSDANVYLALIPDKNYFLAKESGHLSIDYEMLYAHMQDNLPYMTYIEIADLLSIEDYYHTDTHWKQESILDVATRLASQMGVSLEADYEKVTLETPFYGVYYGQMGLPIEADKISYLTNPMFENCIVYDHQNQIEIPMYDMTLAKGRDAYEMFLSGSLSVITIENPNATTDKELVIFRDSFGSSISPLMVEGYQKITLIDIRYINERMIGNFVEFTNQDVLFLFSTSVINNETAF